MSILFGGITTRAAQPVVMHVTIRKPGMTSTDAPATVGSVDDEQHVQDRSGQRVGISLGEVHSLQDRKHTVVVPTARFGLVADAVGPPLLLPEEVGKLDDS